MAKINYPELRTPTAELVGAACKQFDKENAVTEEALNDLFSQYAGNDNHPHILLKVVALNRLYSTQIFAVHDVASHIHQLREIDYALAKGSPEIVDKIAKVTISATGKQRSNFAFATKYCSWHNQASYPIWDSRVAMYLWCLRGTSFARFLGSKPDLWDYYKEFVKTMTAFRDFYNLGSFTFKQIDKFLWLEGASLQ
jgi:hypothetical protein